MFPPNAYSQMVLPTQMANPYATQLFASGPLNLYSQYYLTVNRGNENEQSGGILLSTPRSSNPTWWHLNVFANELVSTAEIFDSFVDDDDLMQSVKGAEVGTILSRRAGPVGLNTGPVASRSSVLKVKISYVEYPTQRRRIIVQDIGPGFDMPLGPTQQVDVQLLAPDPDAYTGPFPVPGTGPDNIRFATWVNAQCQPCVNGVMSRDIGGRFTQSVVASSPDPGVSAGFVRVPIADGARRIQIFTDLDGSPEGRWVFAEGVPFRGGRLGFIPGEFHTFNVDIPQNAKAIELRPADGAVTAYTVVQDLQL